MRNKTRKYAEQQANYRMMSVVLAYKTFTIDHMKVNEDMLSTLHLFRLN